MSLQISHGGKGSQAKRGKGCELRISDFSLDQELIEHEQSRAGILSFHKRQPILPAFC
jgi:hypothetical protein